MAEPNPTRDDSPTMFWVISTDSSSRPLSPLLMTYTMSNARSDSMMVMTRIDDVDRAEHRQDHPEERLPLGGAIDGGGLPERRVDALQARQVEDHDVADVAPAGGHQDRGEVDVLVAEPADDRDLRCRYVPRTLLMKPSSGAYCSCQMNPTIASDRTTGR